ncbi:hypothetical protein F5Y15DRAFT_181930 [Xylariaceae sp. FL0016]|nr:hypothetical protein F5Y15DRAFT_181930 [Xylariaceae sp. FL0016]
MALTPHWNQPSHPEVQEVIINEREFTSKSLAKVSLPPFALFAKMDFPPCTPAEMPTYATVQCGKDKHLNLNSDLLYINHSCEPSLIFDTSNFQILAGPSGLRAGQELTFFYPSTEWSMAQPFDCLCGAPSCRGRISGANDMTPAQLSGLWLNGHIRALLEEQTHGGGGGSSSPDDENPTARALRDALGHAEKVVESARAALQSYVGSEAPAQHLGVAGKSGFPANGANGHGVGMTRRGATSRELSGEMGGDTVVA